MAERLRRSTRTKKRTNLFVEEFKVYDILVESDSGESSCPESSSESFVGDATDRDTKYSLPKRRKLTMDLENCDTEDDDSDLESASSASDSSTSSDSSIFSNSASSCASTKSDCDEIIAIPDAVESRMFEISEYTPICDEDDNEFDDLYLIDILERLEEVEGAGFINDSESE